MEYFSENNSMWPLQNIKSTIDVRFQNGSNLNPFQKTYNLDKS